MGPRTLPWKRLVLVIVVSAAILVMHGLGSMSTHTSTDTTGAQSSLHSELDVVAPMVMHDGDGTARMHAGALCVWVLVTIGALALLARRSRQVIAILALTRGADSLNTLVRVPSSARASPTAVLLC